MEDGLDHQGGATESEKATVVGTAVVALVCAAMVAAFVAVG